MTTTFDIAKNICRKYKNVEWIEDADLALFYEMSDDPLPDGVNKIGINPEEATELAESTLNTGEWFNKNGPISLMSFHEKIASLEGGSASVQSEDPRHHHHD